MIAVSVKGAEVHSVISKRSTTSQSKFPPGAASGLSEKVQARQHSCAQCSGYKGSTPARSGYSGKHGRLTLLRAVNDRASSNRFLESGRFAFATMSDPDAHERGQRGPQGTG
jgi:hypothetical protein